MSAAAGRGTAVVVHYRGLADTLRCLESLAADAAGAGMVLDVVVADNSESGEAADLARQRSCRYVASPDNPGYAAGINRALARTLSDAHEDFVLISNPDVVYRAGALAALAAALADPRVGAAGPRLFWDEAERFLLPPSRLPTLGGELGWILADRVPSLGAWRERNWMRRTVEFWKDVRPRSVPMLAGAVIATRRDVLEQVGGFDEGFRLYFEETDWLRRVQARGLSLIHEPRARAVHFFNQSAGTVAESAQRRYAASERHYFRKHYGAAGEAMRSTLARWPPRWPFAEDLGVLPGPPELPAFPPGEVLLEVSPNPNFLPSAGGFWTQRSKVPQPQMISEEIWRRLQPGRYFSRLWRYPELEKLGAWSFVKSSPTC